MSAQKENGYTAIANELMEALAKYPIPGAQMQCLLVILRKTYGYNKKTDAISLSQFQKHTGLTRRNVARAINGLKEKNLICSKKGGVKNDTVSVSKYRFNKAYKSWNSSVKKDTGSVNCGKKVVSNLTHTKDNIQKKIYTDKLKTFVGNYISFIKKTYPTKAPSGKNVESNSLDVMDKLIRLDGFEDDYIFNALRWAKDDEFWSQQVFSLAGLRKKSKNGLTKFQNLSNAYDKEKPDECKPKVTVMRIAASDC